MAAVATRTIPEYLVFLALDAARAFHPKNEYELHRCFSSVHEAITRLGLQGIPKPEHRVGFREDHMKLLKSLWAYSGRQFDKHKELAAKVKLEPLDLKPSPYFTLAVQTAKLEDPEVAFELAEKMQSRERRECLTQIAISIAEKEPDSAFRVYRQFISNREYYKRNLKQIDKVAEALGKTHLKEIVAFAQENAYDVQRERLRIASCTANIELLEEVLKTAKDNKNDALLKEVAEAYGKYNFGKAHELLRLIIELNKNDDLMLSDVVCSYATIARGYRNDLPIHNQILRHSVDLLPRATGMSIHKVAVEASYSDLDFALAVAGRLKGYFKSWALEHMCFKLAAERPEDAIKVCHLIPNEDVKSEVFLFLAQFITAVSQ